MFIHKLRTTSINVIKITGTPIKHLLCALDTKTLNLTIQVPLIYLTIKVKFISSL